MTRRLSELTDLTATAGETRMPVRALFHDRETMRLRQVAVDAGSWLSRREILITADRFDAPQDETWPMRMTQDDLEAAPEWDHAAPGSGLPPLVVGPFGYTFSPMLMAAGLASSAERGLPDAPNATTDDAPRDLVGQDNGFLAGLERSGDLVGPDAFGPNGRIGTVTDLLFDDAMVIVALIVGEDDPVEMRLDRVRHRAEQGYFVFD